MVASFGLPVRQYATVLTVLNCLHSIWQSVIVVTVYYRIDKLGSLLSIWQYATVFMVIDLGRISAYLFVESFPIAQDIWQEF